MPSTPPASITSPSSALIARAAALIAARPEAQSRLNVTPATETGKPARRAAIRATFRLSSPAWFAQPRYTSSMSAESRPARRTTSPTTTAARSSGRTSLRMPRWRPIGVRTAPTISSSVILDLRAEACIPSLDLDFGVEMDFGVETSCFAHLPHIEGWGRKVYLYLKVRKWKSVAARGCATSPDGDTSTSGTTNGTTVGRGGGRTTSAASIRTGPDPNSCGGWRPTIGGRSKSSPDGGRGSRALSRRIPPLRGTLHRGRRPIRAPLGPGNLYPPTALRRRVRLEERPFGGFARGRLSVGCRQCTDGSKMVLFVTGLCSFHCFYCPVSDEKMYKDVVFADEKRVLRDEDVLDEPDACLTATAEWEGE